jgi:hypothetical protein
VISLLIDLRDKLLRLLFQNKSQVGFKTPAAVCLFHSLSSGIKDEKEREQDTKQDTGQTTEQDTEQVGAEHAGGQLHSETLTLKAHTQKEKETLTLADPGIMWSLPRPLKRIQLEHTLLKKQLCQVSSRVSLSTPPIGMDS